MWLALLFNAITIILLAVVTEGDTSEKAKREVAIPDPVFIEINPNILRSKEVIKFDSKKRLKRGKIDDKHSLVLQITPEFFSNPKLQNLYAAITGIDRKNENHESLDDETKLIFQINPLMLPGMSLKRELDNNGRENNVAAFSLKINPVVPRRLPSVRYFNRTCLERPISELWCKTHREYSKCPAIEPTIRTTTKCLPSKPSIKDINKHLKHYCNIDWSEHIGSPNPCGEDAGGVTVRYTKEYTQCKNSPAPTVKPSCNDYTTATCKDFTRTPPTEPKILELETPIVTQKCDTAEKFSSGVKEEGLYPQKYFVLVKRSPINSWSRSLRKKRADMDKTRFYLVPIKK